MRAPHSTQTPVLVPNRYPNSSETSPQSIRPTINGAELRLNDGLRHHESRGRGRGQGRDHIRYRGQAGMPGQSRRADRCPLCNTYLAMGDLHWTPSCNHSLCKSCCQTAYVLGLSRSCERCGDELEIVARPRCVKGHEVPRGLCGAAGLDRPYDVECHACWHVLRDARVALQEYVQWLDDDLRDNCAAPYPRTVARWARLDEGVRELQMLVVDAQAALVASRDLKGIPSGAAEEACNFPFEENSVFVRSDTEHDAYDEDQDEDEEGEDDQEGSLFVPSDGENDADDEDEDEDVEW